MRHFLILLSLAVFLLVAGCSEPASTDSNTKSSGRRPKITATTGYLGDLARVLAGNEAEVVVLMGPGVDPHTYRATPSDLNNLRDADVVLAHGMGLEGRLMEAIEGLRRQGRKVIMVQDVLKPDDLIKADGDGHSVDPHVWFSPRLWIKAGQGVQRVLTAAAPNIRGSESRLEAWVAEVKQVEEESKTQFAKIPKESRVLMTAHDAFAYLGREFEIEVHGIQGISTATEASAASISNLAKLAIDKNVRAVFVETSVSPSTIEALKKAVEAKDRSIKLGGTLFSDALGDEGTPEGTYVGALRHNLKTIAEALK